MDPQRVPCHTQTTCLKDSPDITLKLPCVSDKIPDLPMVGVGGGEPVLKESH